MRFEWDSDKNERNRRKHGLSFEEASGLFATDGYLEIPDDTHADAEQRFWAIGPIQRGVILVVWTERAEDVVRIISARNATKGEIAMYHRYVCEG